MKKLSFLFTLLFLGSIQAQISGKLMQYPDVSHTHITFIFGDDVWIMPKSGGIANRLSSPEGAESFPRFSPDGKMIAYTANYQGNDDVYVIEVNGGIPKRLTYHGMPDRVLGWSPDGKSVLFASSRESGRQRYSQFYTVSITDGALTKLPVPYGEYASFSPDGQKIAYTDRTRVQRNWKRYRGGTAPDITVFDLKTFECQNITNNIANDELPMWVGNTMYYMSDNGPNKRNNLWKHDNETKTNTQLTHFVDYDITYPESSSSDIIFEAGGKLYLFNLETEKTSEVNVQIISDQKNLISQQKNVAAYMHSVTLSPDGNRVVIEARGDLFNLPATDGFVSDLTASSGIAEREPSWSPDGKHLAYWSDATGEYQLVLYDVNGNQKPKTVTNFKTGFYYSIFWSPDSKKIMYVNQAMDINFIDVNTGDVIKADKGKYMFEGNLQNFKVNWSPDSNWAVYSRSTDNRSKTALFLYDVKNKKVSQLTSGYYSDSNPTFSKDGKYLFFTTSRTFNPVYSDLDNTFVYPNSTTIAVGTLSAKEKSLLEVKNDAIEDSKKEDEKEKNADKKKKDSDKEVKKEIAKTVIDINGFENRVEMLDLPVGRLTNLQAVDGKLLFVRFPNSGASEEE